MNLSRRTFLKTTIAAGIGGLAFRGEGGVSTANAQANPGKV
jgi:hypothetical protein